MRPSYLLDLPVQLLLPWLRSCNIHIPKCNFVPVLAQNYFLPKSTIWNLCIVNLIISVGATCGLLGQRLDHSQSSASTSYNHYAPREDLKFEYAIAIPTYMRLKKFLAEIISSDCASDDGTTGVGAKQSHPVIGWLEEGFAAYKRHDWTRACYCYERAGRSGKSEGWHNLGTMYLHGQGVVRDWRKAQLCLVRAANGGIAASMCQMGYMFMNGVGVELNYTKAVQWFRRAAEMGEPYGQYYLGISYLLGIGVDLNTTKGINWINAAAKQDYVPALYNLGLVYLGKLATKTTPNTTLALEFLTRAAELGDKNSMNNLGVLHSEGKDGVKKSFRTAIPLYRRAAQKGLPQAYFNLGKAYSEGHGTPKNYQKAIHFYKMAAGLGSNPEAEFNIGCLYLTGKEPIIAQNQNTALKWFEKAAKKGHLGARNNVYVLRSPRTSSLMNYHRLSVQNPEPVLLRV